MCRRFWQIGEDADSVVLIGSMRRRESIPTNTRPALAVLNTYFKIETRDMATLLLEADRNEQLRCGDCIHSPNPLNAA
jgi:hypothetical protein